MSSNLIFGTKIKLLKMNQLDLRKQVVLDLKKTIGLDGQKATVVLVLDKSGSMQTRYQNGFVQRLLDRVLPIGLGFDDDQSVDLIVFHHEAFMHTPITRATIGNIVADVVKSYQWGATNYAPPINLLMDVVVGKQVKTGGVLGMGGTMKRPNTPQQNPVYVIYVTDGQNDDKSATEESLRECSQYPIFFQFVGIGNERFTFLQKLDDLPGRVRDNADFFQANDLDSISDDELYSRMMTEFPEFVRQCKTAGLIR